MENASTPPTNDELFKLVNLAEQYDQLGLYDTSDKIYDYLRMYSDRLSKDTQLRLVNRAPKWMQSSMSGTEGGKGYMHLKGNPQAYMTGKGQQAFNDHAGLATQFS
jgi:hypothetical protein